MGPVRRAKVTATMTVNVKVGSPVCRCPAPIHVSLLLVVRSRWATWIIAVTLIADRVLLDKVTVIMTVNARVGSAVFRLPVRMYAAPIQLAI